MQALTGSYCGLRKECNTWTLDSIAGTGGTWLSFSRYSTASCRGLTEKQCFCFCTACSPQGPRSQSSSGHVPAAFASFSLIPTCSRDTAVKPQAVPASESCALLLFVVADTRLSSTRDNLCLFNRPVCFKRGNADNLSAGCKRRASIFAKRLLCSDTELCVVQVPGYYSSGRVSGCTLHKDRNLWKNLNFFRI